MPLRYRKSLKAGPFRVSVSNRGVGGSVGAGGLRYSTRAGRRRRGGPPCCLSLLILMPIMAPLRLIRARMLRRRASGRG